MSEIALLSSRRSRLEEKAKQGKSGAKIALDLLKHPERFLSTVQIGITVVGVILGAFGGEAFATNLNNYLSRHNKAANNAYLLWHLSNCG